jgi:hypothetical protein
MTVVGEGEKGTDSGTCLTGPRAIFLPGPKGYPVAFSSFSFSFLFSFLFSFEFCLKTCK